MKKIMKMKQKKKIFAADRLREGRFIIKRDHDAFQLKEKEETLIKQVVDACMLLSEYELADRSQKENGPWYQTFFVKREEVIPVECMRKYVRE